MSHSTAVSVTARLGLETDGARARRELVEGVTDMLRHYKAYSVACLPHHAKVYLASLFYAVEPGYLDDFCAGELGLHATLIANLKADSNPSPSSDLLERQRAFYVRCQKWLVDYALGGIQKVLEDEGLA